VLFVSIPIIKEQEKLTNKNLEIVKTKIVLLLILILALVQGINAQNNSKMTGFAGLSGTVSPDAEFGGGIEAGAFKNWFGAGFQIEYLPALNHYDESVTYARIFLLFKVTDNFYLKPSGGIEARDLGSRDSYNENFANIGFSPMFIFKKLYLGVQPNLTISYEGLHLSTLSVLVGIKLNNDPNKSK
jgi:hypothetical protein